MNKLFLEAPLVRDEPQQRLKRIQGPKDCLRDAGTSHAIETTYILHAVDICRNFLEIKLVRLEGK
jgi:hypothetical protein